jgi:diguanylate cyclase (GGDEF)-like protein
MGKPFALIIEDDRDVAALFRHVLDLAGFRTEIVFHGSFAIERLSHSLPDIVLLDLKLPGISGGQILEKIRTDGRLSHTRVVVITGNAHVVGALSVQPDLVLLKPVSVEQLTSLVSRITLSNKSSKAIPLQQKSLDDRTGLYNQSFFKNRLESSLIQSREIDPYLFAVILFKVEPTNKIENPADVSVWESVVQEIAGTLRKILRPTDTLARFDPDTFYILIENIPNGEISLRIANRIQEILYRNIADIIHKIKIPIRVGILICDQGYENIDVILNDAKYAQVLAIAQGDEYSKYYYQFSTKKKAT